MCLFERCGKRERKGKEGERSKEREEGREIDLSPLGWFTPHLLTMAKMPCQSRKLRTLSSYPIADMLEPSLPPFEVFISRYWFQEPELGIKPRYFDLRCGHLQQQAKYLPWSEL